MGIERIPIIDRDTWLAGRKHDVTASTIGALFGCHPYVTALRLYAEKRGTEFPDTADDKIMRRGRWLEPAVARAVEELRPQWQLTQAREYFTDATLRLGATPDYWIDEVGANVVDPWNKPRGILQIKTAAPSVFERDWKKGAEPPLWVLLQASTEMMLTDAAFAAVAVMLVDAHAMDVMICDLPRNPAVEEKIIHAVGEFWRMVAQGREPDPDYGRDRDVLRALHPTPEPGKQIDLRERNDLPDMLAKRARMLAENKANKADIEKIETALIHHIGDAETALIDGWRITYKMRHVEGYTVAPRDQRTLSILDRREKT
jgi:predicted phage-related endonuclease